MYTSYWQDRVDRYVEKVKELKMRRDMLPPSDERDRIKRELEQALVDKRNIEEYLERASN